MEMTFCVSLAQTDEWEGVLALFFNVLLGNVSVGLQLESRIWSWMDGVICREWSWGKEGKRGGRKGIFAASFQGLLSPGHSPHLFSWRTSSWSLGSAWPGSSFSVGVGEWEEASLSPSSTCILMFPPGAVTGCPMHHGAWNWAGTIWNSVSAPHVDVQISDN